MRTFSVKQVFVIWVFLVAISSLSLLMPHEPLLFSSVLNNSIQMLLFVTCLHIVKHEPTRRNRYVFLNLTVAFGFSLLFHLYNFVPGGGSYFRLFYYQYVSGAFQFALTFAIAYLTIDFLFTNRMRAAHKYAVTFIIFIRSLPTLGIFMIMMTCVIMLFSRSLLKGTRKNSASLQRERFLHPKLRFRFGVTEFDQAT